MSTLKVDSIQGYTGSDVAITGSIASASFASTATTADTASSLSSGNKTLSGVLTQNFTAPAFNNEEGFINVSGASINGKPYNRVFSGFANYSGSFGLYGLEDYFGIEYYDSFSYNYGSEFNVNGIQTRLITQASGSFQTSYVITRDNLDGTSEVKIGSGNKVSLESVMQLKDWAGSLPTGASGQLAVSNNNLYYHNGTSWAQIN